jgi:hypothetical protein
MITDARDGFRQVVRAEWTKLRSVRRWVVALGAAVVLTVLLSLLAAAGSGTDINRYPNFVTGPDGTPVADEFHFAHEAMTGDGSIVARVVSQENSHEQAAAGIMMKDGITSGSRYAAVFATPGSGVQMRANYTDTASTGASAGRWLRLTRTAGTITGYESTDGSTWQEIGSFDDVGLPPTVEVGLFVSSPPRVVVERQAGSTSVGEVPTVGSAAFDNVSVNGTTPTFDDRDIRPDRGASDPAPVGEPGGRGDGAMTMIGSVYTLTGSGKIGPNAPDDDPVQVSLFGILAGVLVLVAVSVLSMTSEFKRDVLRTTFAASPRRGRVLAAKALVVGGTAVSLGLVASIAAFFVAQPVLRDRGWTPPAYPPPSLADGPVLRAVLTTALFVAAIALLSLGVAAIMRHSAAAITTVTVLVLVPFLLGATLPAEAARWVMQLTPAGGLATQRAKPPTVMLVDPSAMINPWSGLAVACLYAAAALAGAWWLLCRRDA